ncbi:hypothetical protein BDV95DRAFT_595940 [Massariosphaeria phaeospora]|uniref:Peptidase metallopeptidase domain-containing protein n=1 Tax=Massariosphaeria phaeospora TaxID=100035 RepID=A0A7C8I7Y7_9PLEO|nr:hypothetical protein BDV95DRAFT_595940 [Massariosphaeria phaeospora]
MADEHSVAETQSRVNRIKICYQSLPSFDDNDEVPASNLVIAADNASGPAQLAIGKDKFWDLGQTLKVSWWDGPGQTGSDALKKRVKKFAKEWDALCNINLDFGNYGQDAEIRVAFQVGDGSWSFVGKDCLNPKVKKSEPTMNFGWLADSSSDEDVRSVVLHEFGHALGCIHEHQNPDVGIKWNEDLVIKEFSKPPNSWSVKKIRRNILDPVATSMNSVFDPDSIMLYAYDAELTLNGKGTHENKELSAMDISFIKKLYPPQARDDGFFDTDELVAKGGTPDMASGLALTGTEVVTFEPPFKAPPKIAIGLARIDMACKANKAVAATVDRISAQSAQVSVSTWDTSILYGGAATWVEAQASDSQWQFGEFNTQEQRDRNDTSSQTAQKTIYFEEAYAKPPTVVVVLKLIDLENHKDYRVQTYASDICEDRFTIHIDTWGDSILYAGAASWMAYPADLKTSLSASFVTKEGRAKTTERFEFSAGKFVKKPTVRTFLNMIDIKCGTDLRIKTWADQITQNGLDWHADTWKDTQLRQAGVSIVAWA